MYELVQVAPHAYYFDCPAKVGLIANDSGGAFLVDGGSDKDSAKKVLRQVRERGWSLEAVYCTHSHADHIGGNRYLQEQTSCRVFAPGVECGFVNHPELEPGFLWGGSPLPELRHKFLLAAPSVASPLVPEALPAGVSLIDLPGHCFGMVGLLTCEGVAFVADSVVSPQTLAKYGVSYLYDVEAHLATLERLRTLDARVFVPAHAPATSDIAPLAQLNIDAVREVGERVCALAETPSTFEDLLAGLFEEYGLVMSAQQYVLIGNTLRAYLTWLHAAGRLDFSFEANRMLWRRV